MDAATISAILAGIGGIITALSGGFVIFRKQNTEDYAQLSKSVIQMRDEKTELENRNSELNKELAVCKRDNLSRLYDLDTGHRRIEARLARQIIAAGLEPENYAKDIIAINQIIEDQKNC